MSMIEITRISTSCVKIEYKLIHHIYSLWNAQSVKFWQD